MIAYIYDIVIVLILFLGIITGYKRGVIKTILSLLCMIIAFVTASFFSSPEMCSVIYDKYFHEPVSERVEYGVAEVRQQIRDKLNEQLKETAYEMIDKLPFGSEQLKAYVDESVNTEGISAIYEFLGIDIRTLLTNSEISGKIDMIADEYSVIAADAINKRLPLGIKVRSEDIRQIMTDVDAQEAMIYEVFGISSEGENEGAAVYIEKKIIRPMSLRVLGAVLWTVIFAVVNFLLHIAVQIILIIRKLKPVKVCDNVLGAVMGAVGGSVVISVFTVIIVMVVNVTGGMSFMNEDIFSETVLFGKIYEIFYRITG